MLLHQNSVYTAYSGYAGPSFTEYVGKDFDLGGTRFTAKNTLGESISKKADRERKAREAQERRDKNQLIGIGKSAVQRSLLAQTVDKDQQDKESGTWNGMLRTARGIYDAATGGYYATGEAVSKAGEAFTSDPRIYGTTAAAIAMPAIVATTVLGGKEVLGVGAAGVRRAAPHLSKGIDKLGKAAKRSKNFVKDASQKTEAKISSSRVGRYIDSSDIADGATSLIEGLPPSQSRGGAGVAVANELYTRYQNQIKSDKKGKPQHAKQEPKRAK
ncbi:hypothetical protein [Desulfovibrio sp. JC022]|uniref:hypothetical protein n=1 Tax=Desulfovibrio sp. JC022 TaxID=2593642 RepID=UPI0013D48631|nr:hypothetical protein [Desulfovibrio sp. JC022]NDV24972.1 hypothetical protein [Desulfovibrio sp. JC022]